MYKKEIGGYNYWVNTIKMEGKIYYGVFCSEVNNINLFKIRLIFVADSYEACVDYINM